MSNIRKFAATKELLEKLRVPSISRQVIVKTVDKNRESTTESGILKIGDTDWAEAVHADRFGVVVSCPGKLPFVKGGDLMPWETEVHLSKGWCVYFDYLAGLNCDMYVDEDGAEYRLLNYDDLNLAITERYDGEDFDLQQTVDGKFWVIPLNGFHLFETVFHTKKGEFDISPDIVDQRYAVVKYVAINNTAYENGLSVDHLELEVGDKVRFGKIPQVMLEEEAYASFDGGRMYRRSQARNIEMLWRDGALILPQGKLLIRKLEDEDLTPGGIILLKPNVKNHTGEVVVSSVHECPVGSMVKYTKGVGHEIDYRGEKHRILNANQVLYIEE